MQPSSISSANINNLIDIYRHMPSAQIQRRQVYAVASGAPVSFSSAWDLNHTHYWLDYSLCQGHCWSSKANQIGHWIGVSQEFPKLWTGLILQGRGDYGNQYVKQIIVLCTLDGKSWNYVDQGKRFQANSNRHQKVHIDFFQPIFARAIRIYPQSWNEHMSLRFDAIYVNLD